MIVKSTKPLNQKIKSIKPSATLVINERSKELIGEGKKVFKLGFGQSPFPVPEVVVKSLQENAYHKDYLPVLGLPALRKAVAEHARRTLKIEAGVDQVMIGPGSKELIFEAQMAMDVDLLLPSPSWVSYQPQASLAGKEVYWISTHEYDNWLLKPDSLEAACKYSESEYKLLIINYPNNPTGTTYSKSDFQALVGVLRKYNVIVIADEIYGETHHNGEHISLANFYPEGTIISSGLSKWCGAGGWRLGTFIFPKELSWLKDTMRVLASESFSAVSAPIQYAAVTAFLPNKEIENYITNSRLVLKWIGNQVHQSLEAMNIHCPAPVGGFYLFPNFDFYKSQLNAKGITTSAQLCERLLEETGIAVLPGSAFGRHENELTARLAYVDFNGSQLLKTISKTKRTGSLEMKDHCPNIAQAMQVLSSWVKNLA